MLKHYKSDNTYNFWAEEFWGYQSGNVTFYHRINAPSYIVRKMGSSTDQQHFYYVADIAHNLNSYSYVSGNKRQEFLAGKRHCIDGPAISTSHSNRFFINGIEYTMSKYNRILKLVTND